jgi:hypothetical protein
MLTSLFSHCVYMHYIPTRGPLEVNLRVHLPGGALSFLVVRMYTFVVVSMNAFLLLVVAIIDA